VKSVFSRPTRFAGVCGVGQLGESRCRLLKCDRDFFPSFMPTVCRSSVREEVHNLSCLHWFRELASIKVATHFTEGCKVGTHFTEVCALSSDRGGTGH
jgi:hypothetical protein